MLPITSKIDPARKLRDTASAASTLARPFYNHLQGREQNEAEILSDIDHGVYRLVKSGMQAGLTGLVGRFAAGFAADRIDRTALRAADSAVSRVGLPLYRQWYTAPSRGCMSDTTDGSMGRQASNAQKGRGRDDEG